MTILLLTFSSFYHLKLYKISIYLFSNPLLSIYLPLSSFPFLSSNPSPLSFPYNNHPLITILCSNSSLILVSSLMSDHFLHHYPLHILTLFSLPFLSSLHSQLCSFSWYLPSQDILIILSHYYPHITLILSSLFFSHLLTFFHIYPQSNSKIYTLPSSHAFQSIQLIDISLFWCFVLSQKSDWIKPLNIDHKSLICIFKYQHSIIELGRKVGNKYA